MQESICLIKIERISKGDSSTKIFFVSVIQNALPVFLLTSLSELKHLILGGNASNGSLYLTDNSSNIFKISAKYPALILLFEKFASIL